MPPQPTTPRSAPTHPVPALGPSRPFLGAVRQTLADHADPARAPGQQAYMKSALPYHGLTAPALRAALRPVLADPALRMGSRAQWEATVRALFDEATHREEWYAALALARHRRYREWVDPEAMPLWRHLVTTGAWWDVVDDVATHLVRDTLLAHPATERPRMLAWARESDLWVRRTAILSQIGARERTDLELLAAVIEPNVHDREFFVRKAIGWSLRDAARAEPTWVRRFVAEHPDLSGLSRREALKHLGAPTP